MKRYFKIILVIILVVFIISFFYFMIGFPKKPEKITWGVNFSQKQATNLGLNWKKAYTSLLDDLGAKNIKIASYWDLIEPKQGEYSFSDLDWQVQEAEKRGVKIILAIGMKTPRWPECHIPEWAKDISKEEPVLKLLETIVLRYKENKAIAYWQVENEPFFEFGICPKIEKGFIEKEVKLVRFLDSRPIIVSDTGEMSFWLKPAKIADIVGVTMYRRVFSNKFNMFVNFPFTPSFYWRRAQIIGSLYNKKVICVELQAEPWGKKLLWDLSLEEQAKAMNFLQFKKNIDFAKKTGLNEFYLWGFEWWYWLKTEQNNPIFFDEIKKQCFQ